MKSFWLFLVVMLIASFVVAKEKLPNVAPTAVADEVITNKNTSVTFDVLANDSDVDSPNIYLKNVTNVINGTVTFTKKGLVTFIPNVGYLGQTTFNYTVSDHKLDSVGVVTVNVVWEDKYEENDTMATATNLDPLGLDLMNLVLASGDEDWYSFTISNNSNVEVLLLFPVGGGAHDLDAYLYDELGNLVAKGESGYDNENFRANDLPTGKYFLQVKGYNYADGDYQMHLSVVDLTNDDLYGNFEANGAINLSAQLTNKKGQLKLDDLKIFNNKKDVYQIQLLQAGILNIKLIEADGSALRNLHILVLDENSIPVLDSSSDDDIVKVDNAIAGTYTIEITSDNTLTSAYDLCIFAGSLVVDDNLEDNDSQAQATTINLVNGLAELNGLELVSFDEDWYKVSVTGSTLNLDAIFTPGNGEFDLDVEVLDANGNLVGSGTSGSPNESVVLNGLAAGDYFIRIYGWNDAHNSYSLKVSSN